MPAMPARKAAAKKPKAQPAKAQPAKPRPAVRSKAPTHSSPASLADLKRANDATKGQPKMLFIYSEGCPYCVMMKPAWDRFVASKPKISTVGVPSGLFDAGVKAKAVEPLEFSTVPFVCIVTKDGDTRKFDEFLAMHPKGGEGRTSANLSLFAAYGRT